MKQDFSRSCSSWCVCGTFTPWYVELDLLDTRLCALIVTRLLVLLMCGSCDITFVSYGHHVLINNDIISADLIAFYTSFYQRSMHKIRSNLTQHVLWRGLSWSFFLNALHIFQRYEIDCYQASCQLHYAKPIINYILK